MKATFRCSTLEQAHAVVQFAHKDGLYVDAEVVVTLEGEPVKVERKTAPLPSVGLKDDAVDALLPLSFFGAEGTKYLNRANIGKTIAFVDRDETRRIPYVGKFCGVMKGHGCLEARVAHGDCAPAQLRLDCFNFVFLE